MQGNCRQGSHSSGSWEADFLTSCPEKWWPAISSNAYLNLGPSIHLQGLAKLPLFSLEAMVLVFFALCN